MNLTKRQLEVWEALASGQPRKEAAKRLGISHKTFDAHLEILKHRLKVRGGGSAVVLTRMWMEHEHSGPDSVC